MMDLLNGNVKKLFLKYFAASFGSALITSVYGLIDTVMVGRYHGPAGAAAMAVVAPVWNIIYSFGLLSGIGGSILFSARRGTGRPHEDGNEYFSASLILTACFSVLLWCVVLFLEDPLLVLFGADEQLLPLAKRYLIPIRYTVPVFLFTQFLSAFLRNDSDPQLATKAVLSGGAFNVIGDYLLVFTFDMGIFGAGLATAISSIVSLLVMMTHFLRRTNTLKFVRPVRFPQQGRRIIATGFSTFFIDIAMGMLTMLFNRQIMRYFNADALAVYGIIVNIGTFVQCCAYGVGQAVQPILSINYGARKRDRIVLLIRYSMVAVFAISCAWVALTQLFPKGFVRLFMVPTASVLEIAPAIIRTYCLSFIFLPLNIFSTYYFQSVMRPSYSFIISVARGIALSGLSILAFPAIFGGDALWFAMPVTELVVAVFVGVSMVRSIGKLSGSD